MPRLSPRAAWCLLLACLTVGTLAGFWSALDGGFIWDDRILIEDNRYIKELRYIPRAFERQFWDVSFMTDEDARELANLYYRPLVTLSYMLDYQLYGSRAGGFHLTNVLLHLLATLLVLLLARRVLGRDQLLAVGVCAAVFALHPSRAEAVSWISGRTDVMMAIFGFTSLLLYWRALERSAAGLGLRRTALLVAGGWATYVLALSCKESAVALAVVVPAVDWLLIAGGDRRQLWARARWCHLPLVGLTGAFVLFRLWYQLGVVGAKDAGLGLSGRLLMLLQTVGHFVKLTVTPYEPNMQVGAYFTPQTADYSVVALGAGAVVGCGVALALAARRSPAATFALLLGLAFFLPSANLVPLSILTLASDRFLYVPLLGLALLAGLGARRLTGSRLRVPLLALGAAMLLSWVMVLHLRGEDFADPVAFWSAEQSSSPQNPLVEERLGSALLQRRQHLKAEGWFNRSLTSLGLRRRPARDKVATLIKLVDTHLLHTRDHKAAALRDVARFLRQLEALSRGPGVATLQIHRWRLTLRGTRADMRRAIASQRGVLLAMVGNIQSRLGQDPQALAALEAGLAAAPQRHATRLNLALAKARAMQLDAAWALLRPVQQAAPDAPEVRRFGQQLKAVQRKVKQLNAMGVQRPSLASTDPAVHWHLAELQRITGALGRACAHLTRVVQLSPDDRKARATLAITLAEDGDLRRALEVVQRARQRFGDAPGLGRLEQKVRQIAAQRR